MGKCRSRAVLLAVLVCVVMLSMLGVGAGIAGREGTQVFAATETLTADPTSTTEAPTSTTEGSTTTTEGATTTTDAPAPPPAPTRYQQTDSRITYLGFWYGAYIWSASGGSFYGSDVADAAAVVTFDGTSIRLIAKTTPYYGKATVTLDGVDEYVDLYSPTILHKQAVYLKQDLTRGPHTLVITRSGEKNLRSSGTAISLDALDIAGELTQAPTDLGDGRPSGVLPKPEWFGLTLLKGSSGEAVAWLEQRLTDLSYRPGAIDGYFDGRTRQAVIAFQKWEWLRRDGIVAGSVWHRLTTAGRPMPRYLQVGKWIEVNKAKQVLLYCVDGVVVRTLATSTGSARVGIATPSGHYHITRKNTWERVRYKPLYLTWRLLAIHGYPSVPTYPASHGCVRITWADMDELNPLIPVGTSVRVY